LATLCIFLLIMSIGCSRFKARNSFLVE